MALVASACVECRTETTGAPTATFDKSFFVRTLAESAAPPKRTDKGCGSLVNDCASVDTDDWLSASGDGTPSISSWSVGSDSDLGEDELAGPVEASNSEMLWPEGVGAFFVYPIALLLRLRPVRSAGKPCVLPVPFPAPISSVPHGGEFRYSAKRSARLGLECTTHVASANCAATRLSRSSGLPKASASSWAARQRAAGGLGSDEKVARATRSILNKLTIEKFEGLYEQLATCGIATADHVALLMQEIFEKATAQHHFIPMYADMCARLQVDPRVAPATERESATFRRLLLNQCQVAFEKLLELHDDQVQADTQEVIAQKKLRALGNVKFVGQLIVRGVLASKLLVDCAETLLHDDQPSPEALESLAFFLPSPAQKLDRPDWGHFARLDAIFVRVLALSQDGVVPNRVRFLLRDVLDLRAAGWPNGPRVAGSLGGPMRLEDIRSVVTVVVGSAFAISDSGPRADLAHGKKAVKKKHASTSDGSSIPAIGEPTDLDGQVAQLATKRAGSKYLQRQLLKDEAHFIRAAACSATKAHTGGPPPWRVGCHRKSVRHEVNVNQAPTGAGDVVLTATPTIGLAKPDHGTDCPPCDAAMAPAAPLASVGNVSEPVESFLVDPSLVADTDAKALFVPAAFHRELSAIFCDLGVQRSVPAAVRRIREQRVPASEQAAEFANILTRAAEETRGPVRRCAFAFAAGLAMASAASAFERKECLGGTAIFFQEVYADLCEEVPRLRSIVAAELIPTLRLVFPAKDLCETLPKELLGAVA